MLPAPPIIIECPHCSVEALKSGFASGNTFGAIFWSDGKMEAPMLPEFPEVVKCSFCKNFYWVDSAKELGTIDFDSKLTPGLSYIDFLDLDEYIELLESGKIKGKRKERYVRTQLWWAFNDMIRYKEATLLPEYISLFNENLALLRSLLNMEKDEDRLMTSEIYRESGEFEAAIDILEDDWPKDLKRLAGQILNKATEKNKVVFRLTIDN